MTKKVAFCIPTMTRPTQPCLDALAASIPVLEEAGWDHYLVSEVGCPYISAARSKMLRKAMDASADVIVFIDHDLSWAPEDLRILIETPGEVVAGTYRFKKPDVEYMGHIMPGGAHDKPIVREDGAVLMYDVPAGFLKLTKAGVQRFMRGYPHLLYDEPDRYKVDLFNHGVIDGVWFGEDYAFCKRWREIGGGIWCVPHLDLVHHAISHDADRRIVYTPYPGNYHRYLATLKGGSLHVLKEAA
jgi:hypothetical protein